jgi:hypothetical protein
VRRAGVHVTHAADHSCAVPGRGARCPRRDDVKRRIARRWTGRQAVSSEEAGHRSPHCPHGGVRHGRTRRADLPAPGTHRLTERAFPLQLWSVCVLSSQHFSTARPVSSRPGVHPASRGEALLAACLRRAACRARRAGRQRQSTRGNEQISYILGFLLDPATQTRQCLFCFFPGCPVGSTFSGPDQSHAAVLDEETHSKHSILETASQPVVLRLKLNIPHCICLSIYIKV